MSIADKITRLITARSNIRAALGTKGVDASSHGFEMFSADIGGIQTQKPEQSKTVTPTAGGFTVTPDNGKVLSSVIINGDADLVAANIKRNVNIFGVTGELDPAPTNIKSFTVTLTETAANAQIAIEADNDIATHCNDNNFLLSCCKISGSDGTGALASLCTNTEISTGNYGICFYNTTPMNISSNATSTDHVKVYADTEGNLRWHSSNTTTRGWKAGTYLITVSW